MGDRIEESGYHLQMKRNEKCNVLCRKEYSTEEGRKFADFIENEYTVSWLVDNMPASVRLINPEDLQDTTLERSFPIGYRMDSPAGPAYFLYNHIQFIVYYHTEKDDLEADVSSQDSSAETNRQVLLPAHVIGVEVVPYSVRHSYEGSWPTSHHTGDGNPDVQLDTCNPARDVDRD